MIQHIAVCYAPRHSAHYDAFPLRVFRKPLRQCGVELSFYHAVNKIPAKSKIDSIILSGYQSWRVFGYASPIHSDQLRRELERLRQRVRCLIWYDSHDSGNVAYRTALEYADLYLKRQIWADKQLYKRPLYGDIVFKDYYHKKYGLEEANSAVSLPLPDHMLRRIQVGWNLALIDWQIHGAGRVTRGLHIYFPHPKYAVEFGTKPLCKRSYDIVWRGSDHSNNQPIVAFHRNTVRDHVERACRNLGLLAITSGRVSHRQYLHEIQNSKIVVSPFGWGEICYRDFESFMAGAILLKPNMDHLETWPNLFHPYQTYVPFSWDFSDIEDKIDDILTHINDYEQIAREGQRRFQEVLSPEYGEQFTQHFLDLLTHLEAS